MTSDQRVSFELRLQAATGYLELGMPLDAHEELEAVDAVQRTEYRVLALRVGVYQALAKWELMETVAKVLCRAKPDESRWPLSLAYATRRAQSLEKAVPILIQAAMAFAGEPTILFNLACYQAQLGYLDAARGRLREAISIEPRYLEMALSDPDLVPLHAELRSADHRR